MSKFIHKNKLKNRTSVKETDESVKSIPCGQEI
jgi:hypothetical protein